MELGDTRTPALLPRLLDQAYVPAPAPEAVNVVLPPLQIVVVPVMAAVGSVLTVTVAVSVSVQPLPSVTVTVYAVVNAGVTKTAALFPRLFAHTYVPAPEAASVVLSPEQIVSSPLITAIGGVLTVITAVSVSVQPFTSVTVTVYVVVVAGITEGVELLPPLPLQL